MRVFQISILTMAIIAHVAIAGKLIHPRMKAQIPAYQLLQGDMLVTPEQMRELNESSISGSLDRFKPMDSPKNFHITQANALLDTNRRWPDKTLRFQLHLNENQDHVREILRKLQKKIENNQGSGSCVKFVESNKGHRMHVRDNPNIGCRSSVGYWRQSGRLNLNWETCAYRNGTIEHEFLHALGIWHTQMRWDRDTYVDIIERNIKKEDLDQFKMKSESDVTHFELPYDYKSVMHYSALAFSKNGRKTIITKDPEKQKFIGQRKGVSELDIKLVREMYNCGECTTREWGSPGKKCVFPFNFGGTTYNHCPPYNGRYWCSLDANFRGNWGYCNEDACPIK